MGDGPKAALIIIVVVVVIGVLVVGSLIAAGIVFLWAQSFTSDSGESDVNNINGRITAYAGSDTIEIEVISGAHQWSDYRVTVDGMEVTTTEPSSGAGETATFTGATFDAGDQLVIKISDISAQRVIFEVTLIARN